MNRTKISVWVVVAVALVNASGRAAPVGKEERAKQCAERMYSAFLKQDLETFAKYTHPRVAQMLGGQAQMLAKLRAGLEGMKAQGVAFQSVQVDRPGQIVRAGKELHAVLALRIVMQGPDGMMLVRSYLLGVSTDEGKSWLFVDGAKLTPTNIRAVLPNFNAKLRLPKPVPPEPIDAP